MVAKRVALCREFLTVSETTSWAFMFVSAGCPCPIYPILISSQERRWSPRLFLGLPGCPFRTPDWPSGRSGQAFSQNTAAAPLVMMQETLQVTRVPFIRRLPSTQPIEAPLSKLLRYHQDASPPPGCLCLQGRPPGRDGNVQGAPM